MGSLEEILARLNALESENRELKSRVAELQGQLEKAQREGKQQAAPFRKPRDQRISPEEHKKPGRPPGHEPSFKKPPSDDQILSTVDVPLHCCPCCSGELQDFAEHEHFVVDVPRVEPVCKRFVTHSGYCPDCKERKSSRTAEMPSNAVGAAAVSFGHNLVALATVLRTQSGMTFRKMKKLFKEWFQLDISQAGLQKVLGRSEAALKPTHGAIAKDVKDSKRVHVDETGWWLAAESHWAWVAATANCTLFVIAKSRGHEVAEALVGKDYQGCLHSDFLNSYSPLSCKKAKCVSHLLAHIDKLQRCRETTERDTRARFLESLKVILQDAIKLWHCRTSLGGATYESQVQWIYGRLDQLLQRRPRDPDNLRLYKRIRKHRSSIFRFFHDPDAEPTNNLAEQQLRLLVVNRKLSGGNRSRRGADRTALLYSVYATLYRQGQNVVTSILDALWGRRTILLKPA